MQEKTPILLIWQEIPDTVKVYFFDNLSDEEYKNMMLANGTYINSNETEETEWLNGWLYDEGSGRSKYEPIAQDSESRPGVVSLIPASCVIVFSGFML